MDSASFKFHLNEQFQDKMRYRQERLEAMENMKVSELMQN